MKLGFIGLGKMGSNMVLRLLETGHEVVAWNRSPEPLKKVLAAGAQSADSLEALVNSLTPPRTIWLMLPAGQVTGDTINTLTPFLEPGDVLVDGANSFYEDTIKRGQALSKHQLNFIDVGVSGGPAGARNGACLMIGGDPDTATSLTPLFESLSAPGAYQFFDGIGAGHFVKMVHNGIEYGMMQAIAEGFAVMKASPFKLDLPQVADIYQHQSVIESRLVGWAKSGFQAHGNDLDSVTSTIAHTGEGEWTINTAEKLNVEVPVIKRSFEFRVESASKPSFTGKVVSMLRNQFGGHSIDSK